MATTATITDLALEVGSLRVLGPLEQYGIELGDAIFERKFKDKNESVSVRHGKHQEADVIVKIFHQKNPDNTSGRCDREVAALKKLTESACEYAPTFVKDFSIAATSGGADRYVIISKLPGFDLSEREKWEGYVAIEDMREYFTVAQKAVLDCGVDNGSHSDRNIMFDPVQEKWYCLDPPAILKPQRFLSQLIPMALTTKYGAERQFPDTVASDCGNFHVELIRPYFVRKVKTNNTVTAVYDARMNGQDVILKVHHLLYAMPCHLQTLLLTSPRGLKDFSLRAQGEANALAKLDQAGCQYAPKLLGHFRKTFGGVVCGTEIYVVISKVPGYSLDSNTAWRSTYEGYEKVERAFEIAQKSILACGVDNAGHEAGNIMYDPDQDKCYIIDFEYSDFPQRRYMRHLPVNFADWVGPGPARPASEPAMNPPETPRLSLGDGKRDDAFTSSPSTLKSESEEDEKLDVSVASSPDAEKMGFELIG
ncbi:uncharacterized protein MYCFIDRAFT_199423 [Pseudocercospora fijiensis CIRAD86]|uniref:Protein kinase domain-containing protein n=1 Tax=Pseudocercospora fijiensis (strain CIRAD86) TaxID=383855 RepID=M2ZL30_PSEFD|nr:uncharacterized protein MYCFIDRAFT_199423 [Pseudocercospora fijiensis CIRAD86]EME79754.1 hypothetical protein MYCFIDRAFT_199423 [Pseudocercospora fijiensis CIRAD86]